MKMDKLERVLALISNVCRVCAIFLPWLSFSLTLKQNDTVIDKQTYLLFIIYSNSMKIGELLTVNLSDYTPLSIIAAGTAFILIIKELIFFKRKWHLIKEYSKDSEFMRYLQLVSQIASILLLISIFALLSDLKFIHPMMLAEMQPDGLTQKLIIEFQYSLGLYFWILSIVLSGPETFSNMNLVYSSLGGISDRHLHNISQKINSIIQYHIANLSTREIEFQKAENLIKEPISINQSSRVDSKICINRDLWAEQAKVDSKRNIKGDVYAEQAKDDSKRNIKGDVYAEQAKNEPKRNKDRDPFVEQTNNAVDEFNKLFFKKN